MIIRNNKNSQIVNLNKVTQITPSINKEREVFNLYFLFDSMENGEYNEVKWELESKSEIDRILSLLNVVDV